MLKIASILTLVSLPLVAFSAMWFTDSFENAVAGTSAKDYDSSLGQYSFTTTQGNAVSYIATEKSCDFSGQCLRIGGPYNAGGAFTIFDLDVLVPGQGFVNFYYKGDAILGSSYLTIEGDTQSFGIDLVGTNSKWINISHELGEPIKRISILVPDHSDILIDEISLGVCRHCK